MHTSWFSYDEVAESYASTAEPAYFAAPAEDLISFLHLQPGMRLLDVGAGSGAVASAAVRILPGSTFVACDSSVPMLVVARRRIGGIRTAAAELPHLPFATGAYDAATLGFVLSHLAQPVAALREIKRVLAAGGQVGVSSWASSPAASPAADLWRSLAERYVEAAEMSAAVARVVPSEGVLSTREGLHASLSEAGFRDVTVREREYSIQISAQQFIQSRLLSAPSRYMQARLDADQWHEFISAASQAIAEKFGEQLTFTASVNLATAKVAG